jgi:hypothetical protein
MTVTALQGSNDNLLQPAAVLPAGDLILTKAGASPHPWCACLASAAERALSAF